jgi:hypothetical protein
MVEEKNPEVKAPNRWKLQLEAARKDPLFVRTAVEQIISAMGALAVSERWQSIRAVLDQQVQPPPQELVCYCLGDVAEEQVAYQLAFFLLLANHWGIRNTGRLVYDPGTLDCLLAVSC